MKVFWNTLILTEETLTRLMPINGKIKTLWTELVNPNNVLAEHLHPLIEREKWRNMNGIRDYAFLIE